MSILSAMNPCRWLDPITTQPQLERAKKIAGATLAVLITSIVLYILTSYTHVLPLSHQDSALLNAASQIVFVGSAMASFLMISRIKDYREDPSKKHLLKGKNP